MSQQTVSLEPDLQEVWEVIQVAYKTYFEANKVLSQLTPDQQIALIQLAFREKKIDEAHQMLHILKKRLKTELVGFIEDLLPPATYLNRFTHSAIELILAFPHEWLLMNLEKYGDELLKRSTDADDYIGLINLYRQIDEAMFVRLVTKARQHTNPDIREIGESWFDSQVSVT